ncbi:hypothetical protein Zm00014a_003176 [Zea mays]|uniref:S-adenosyl-L-methionine-dependent methyltransferase superfamily protein n=1 Tax=Zea mays TaxID=4577 RepID=A0A3L6E6P5_MAIZE|nr:hypothetical protein Zm00014a_003176 [Zea mays]
MKLKQLEGLLGGLTQFSDPKLELEQYATGPHIASRMLYMVSAGTHVLLRFRSFPALFQDAMPIHVLGIDIDPQSLELAQENAADLELDIDLVWSDIKNLNLKGIVLMC